MRPLGPGSPSPNGQPLSTQQIELILTAVSTTNREAQQLKATLTALLGTLRQGKSLSATQSGSVTTALAKLISGKGYTTTLKQAWTAMQALSESNKTRASSVAVPVYDVESIHAADPTAEIKARLLHVTEQTRKAVARVNPNLLIQLKASQSAQDSQSLRQLQQILQAESKAIRALMRADASMQQGHSIELLIHRKIVWNRYICDCLQMSLDRTITAEHAAHVVFNLELAEKLLLASLEREALSETNFLTMAMPVKQEIITKSCPKSEDLCEYPELEVLECMRDSGIAVRNAHIIMSPGKFSRTEIDPDLVVTNTGSIPADFRELGIGLMASGAKDSPYEDSIQFRLQWLEILRVRYAGRLELSKFLDTYIEYNRSYLAQLARFRQGYEFLPSDTNKVFAALKTLPKFFSFYIFMTTSWILPTISKTITAEKPRSQVEFN